MNVDGHGVGGMRSLEVGFNGTWPRAPDFCDPRQAEGTSVAKGHPAYFMPNMHNPLSYNRLLARCKRDNIASED